MAPQVAGDRAYWRSAEQKRQQQKQKPKQQQQQKQTAPLDRWHSKQREGLEQLSDAAASTAASKTRQLPPQRFVSADLFQSILDIFSQAFPIARQREEFIRLIQVVKGHLYHREFNAAFGTDDFLNVYAARWSAARALAYADIFLRPELLPWFWSIKTKTHSSTKGKESSGLAGADTASTSADDLASDLPIDKVSEVNGLPVQSPLSSANLPAMMSTLGIESDTIKSDRDVRALPEPMSILKVVCIGGGAGAEIVALAAASWKLLSATAENNKQLLQSLAFPLHNFLDILAIDIADWARPVERLSSAIIDSTRRFEPQSSALSSDAEIETRCHINFEQRDVLGMDLRTTKEILKDVSVITIMFTLNELFSSSLPKTTAFLLNLSAAIAVGSRLVIVDSPGSYSEIHLGKKGQADDDKHIKRYPMTWLLDHTLLEVAGKDNDAQWVKVKESDSEWFRIDEKWNLRYGIDLENCRYQIHIFEKLR